MIGLIKKPFSLPLRVLLEKLARIIHGRKQWRPGSIVLGGGKGQNFPTKGIFSYKVYLGYNGLQWPNIFELSSFRSAKTVKNPSKYRATLF